MINRLLLLCCLLLSVCFAASASDDSKNQERCRPMAKEFREFKIKFLAQEMDLSSDQAEKFSDLYAQMEEERFRIFQDTKSLERRIKKNPNASDADYEALSNAITNARLKDVEIEKAYDAKFATFLSKKQIFKLKEAEDAFRRKMHQMRMKNKGAKHKRK